MLYLFVGDDSKKKRIAYDKFSNSLGDIVSFSIIKNNFDPMQIESLYSGAGLFFEKCVVYMEGIFESEEKGDFVLDHLSEMQASGNIFVVLEGKLNKPILDVFKKARAEINIFELSKEKKEKYDNFILANDFANKDKFSLWMHYRKAMDLGVKPDELAGVLFWKAKDMLLKKSFGKLSEIEVKNFASKIAYLLPETRGASLDDEVEFEKLLLEAF